MRDRPSRDSVVILAAPGSLEGLDRRLRRSGLRVSRVAGVATTVVPASRWLTSELLGRGIDTVLVSSPRTVVAGVVPWMRRRPERPRVEFWAVGPATARALRRAGARRVRVGPGDGGEALVRTLRAGRRRKVLYLRSDRAGPRLGRLLREYGHEVAEAVVYRVVLPPPLRRADRDVLATADLLVVGSPSALSGLRRRLARKSFEALRRRCRLVVLGSRSLRSARGHGFRGTRVAPSPDAQRLTREVLRGLRDAPS